MTAGHEEMTKTPKPLAVSKDLVTELQRLAVIHFDDDEAYKAARLRYEQATHQALSSTSEFAVALYNFTLAYAQTPELIEAKLNELKIEFKGTSDYYKHISRLVFTKLPDSGAKQQRETFYASLLRKAHTQGLSVDEFKKVVAKGVTKAVQILTPAASVTSNARSLKKAREIASKFFNDETYELPGASLAEDVEDGSELQLLARYKDGKITVYGVVPPHLANTEAVLTKLVASTTKAEKHKYDVLRDMLAVIKLVTKVSDDKAVASYKVKDGKFNFVVAGKKGTAVLAAPSDYDLFARNITLTVPDWGRLISTLMPMRKHIASIDASDTEIVVSMDDLTIPDIHKWVLDKKHVITAGKASGSTLLFELKANSDHLEEPTGRWEPLGSLPADKVEHAFKFKPSKKYTTISFNDDGSIKFGSLARLADNHTHLTKSSYRQLKAAAAKMKGLASELRFEQRKNQLRVSASIDDAITGSLLVGVE